MYLTCLRIKAACYRFDPVYSASVHIFRETLYLYMRYTLYLLFEVKYSCTRRDTKSGHRSSYRPVRKMNIKNAPL